jgi:hypothetical protein
MNAKTLIDALTLWEATGSQIAQAAEETSQLLVKNGIPNLVAGGIAVQLHGYPRFTHDVDLIVPDVEKAHELLMSKGFRQSLKKLLCVLHPNKVEIDLLPAGRCLDQRCQVTFPEPRDSTAVFQPVTLEEIISLKLDSWVRRPHGRGQDKVDVTKLIKANRLPRNFPVHPAMAAHYCQIWDDLAAEDQALGEPPEA